MVKEYVFGSPIETGAIVNFSGNVTKNGMESLCAGELEGVSYQKKWLDFQNKQREALLFAMDSNDIVYGLGETVRGINKRGWQYVSYAADDPVNSEDKVSLYGAHNFIIIAGKSCLGIFVDTPGKVIFDVGYTKKDELVIAPDKMDFKLYIIQKDTPAQVAKEFRKMIGKSYLPPKWALGYGQSRWSYATADEVREVVKNYRENHIPLDSVYMDIDYMERYKDFTIDAQRFPNFAEFVKEMEKQHIHLVPIIDAGIKVEEGYDVYEEGVQNNYFCKDAEGKDFVVGVWPGRVCLPDMLKKETREWFGKKYKILLDYGIDGFWNDMNEPALFYSEENLDAVIEEISQMKGQNLDLDKFFHMKDLVNQLSNSQEDYQKFYHEYDGEKYRHDLVHNLYGYQMTRAAGEAFDELSKGKRILMFSRSSYVGMHRYGGIWTGDNQSVFSHILLLIHQLPAIQMCGFLYTGADLGGFGCHGSEELLTRFIQVGIFTPLMRNHSSIGTRRQEAYQFENKETLAKLIRIRYALLPYLYSELMKAGVNDDPYFQPLGFVYTQDEMAKQVEDQLLLGEEIMIAPVYTQNAKGRYVYLPEDMMEIRMKSDTEYETKQLTKGHHYIEMSLSEVVFFLRKDKMIPLAAAGEYVDAVDEENLTYIANGSALYYDLYTDDGYTRKIGVENVKRILK